MVQVASLPIQLNVTAAPPPPPLAPLTYLGAFDLPVDPSDLVTQLKAGQRVHWLFNPEDKCLYSIGGCWQQSGHSLAEGGSQTLFKWNCVTKQLSVVSPYYSSGGVQLARPDNVSMMFDSYMGPGSANIVVYPGTSQISGGWPPSVTPLAGRVMRWNQFLQAWLDVMAVPAEFPADSSSDAFIGSSSHDFGWIVTRYNGAPITLMLDNQAGIRFVGTITNPLFQAIDVQSHHQFFDDCFEQVCCYDWQTGNVLLVNCNFSNPTSVATVKLLATIQSLPSRAAPFAMVFEPFTYQAICFFANAIRLIDLWTGRVTDGGAPPAGTTGFYSVGHDTNSHTIIATGEAAGSAKIHHYSPPSMPDPTRPILQNQWHDLNVNYLCFHKEHGWQWRTPGGDFTDRNHNLFGNGPGSASAVPYSTNVMHAGFNSWNVLQLFQEWTTEGNNNGVALRGCSDNQLVGRLFVDASIRPDLTVTTSAGTFVCPCSDSSYASGDSAPGPTSTFQAPGHTGALNGGNFIALLKFDVSGVLSPQTATAATMRVNCNFFRSAVTGGVYRPSTPAVREHGTYGTFVGPGLAATMGANDANINNWASLNSNIIFASDFTPGYATRLMGAGAPFSMDADGTAIDPVTGFTALRCRMRAYGRGAGGPRIEFPVHGEAWRDSVYGRFYVKFEQDWLPRQGGKLPFSWDWRMNVATTAGNVTGVATGNGGEGCTGLRQPLNGAFPYTVNVGANRINYTSGLTFTEGMQVKPIHFTQAAGLTEGQAYYVRNLDTVARTFQMSTTPGGAIDVTLTGQPSGRALLWQHIAFPSLWLGGGSERAQYVRQLPMDPYGSFISNSQYSYHAGILTYGDGWFWGSPAAGYGVFKRDKSYCVEFFMQMNTIAGPLDSLGNGVGNADGITRFWINGFLAFEKTDNLFRHHSDMQIQSMWLEIVYGGTHNTEKESHVQISNVVCAKQYIGPKG